MAKKLKAKAKAKPKPLVIGRVRIEIIGLTPLLVDRPTLASSGWRRCQCFPGCGTLIRNR